MFAYHPKNSFKNVTFDLSPTDPLKKGDNSNSINAHLTRGIKPCRTYSAIESVNNSFGIYLFSYLFFK